MSSRAPSLILDEIRLRFADDSVGRLANAREKSEVQAEEEPEKLRDDRNRGDRNLLVQTTGRKTCHRLENCCKGGKKANVKLGLRNNDPFHGGRKYKKLFDYHQRRNNRH